MAESYDISPDVAYRLIVALKDRKLPFIVAPYEADAQLAYLSRNGLVDVVITEDSDLLPYGARCVLYKLDYSTYRGDELNLERLKDNPDPCLRSFTHCMFLSACILSGCDYLPQVRGVGLKSAFQLIGRNKNGRRAIH
jgi:exonuclease-1